MLSFSELANEQKVRVFDIYALGPLLIYAALQKKPLGTWTRRSLFVAGVFTLIYNYKKYQSLVPDLKKEIQNVQSLV